MSLRPHGPLGPLRCGWLVFELWILGALGVYRVYRALGLRALGLRA